jgi:DnaJ-class molecular chaperone
MNSKDFYKTLGVSKTATDAEIKSAYRKLARTHHPDIDKSAGAAEKFKELSEAYQVLSNPEKRKMYDQFGSAAFSGNGAGGGNPFAGGGNPFGGGFSYSTRGGNADFGGFEDPFELFETIFGGGFGNAFSQGFKRRPTYQLDITFDEAVHGSHKEVEVPDEKNQRKRLSIRVPAGVDTGTRMRFGEIEIVFRVKGSHEFQREGADIFTEARLSIPQVVLGDSVDVNTISGKVSLKIPAGTDPGSLIKIKGKGVPHLRGGRGDHYVRVRVEIPKKLSSEEKKLYEALAKTGTKKGWF